MYRQAIVPPLGTKSSVCAEVSLSFFSPPEDGKTNLDVTVGLTHPTREYRLYPSSVRLIC